MTVTVSTFHTVTVPLGNPLARVNPEGELTIWPEGVGRGPMLTMSIADWESIKLSADAAIRARRRHLDDYTATEGNGAEL